MSLKLCLAAPEDAPRIAEIHMAAFANNTMLQAQFPTPAVRVGLRNSIELKSLADVEDAKITVLVVKNAPSPGEDEGKIIAFSKWTSPVYSHETYTEPPWIWPEGTDHNVLEAWARNTEAAMEDTLGDDLCYREHHSFTTIDLRISPLMLYSPNADSGLTFIGTDPAYERRGAGSLMVRWGIERSKSNGVPIYLESTAGAAPFYEGLGFTVNKTVSLQLPPVGDQAAKVYEEITFVFRP